MATLILPTHEAIARFYSECLNMSSMSFDIIEITRTVLDALSNYHDYPGSYENYVFLEIADLPEVVYQSDIELLNRATMDYYEHLFNALCALCCYDPVTGDNRYPYFELAGDHLMVSDRPTHVNPPADEDERTAWSLS